MILLVHGIAVDGGGYSIPMVLLIGWRGMPGYKDEPQRRIKGEITTELAGLCKFDVHVLEDETAAALAIGKAVASARRKRSPTAVVIPPGFAAAWTRDFAREVRLIAQQLFDLSADLSGLADHDEAFKLLTDRAGEFARGSARQPGCKRVSEPEEPRHLWSGPTD